ncbi:alpha/beta fold family hydrolase [Caballeronia arationis]|jgi:pimeloyl-ACP methyl ester carboxylesterase|uniref:Pimeloyl-ACP methyl ester carboxylesterase n=1 Tax=Caballeronia arationis TaxID=1777142 RepID=A0A7Z7N152_9BURK|nr:alpha/beta fold hydrolase [Caballeronia arationis]SAK77334.1 alpha/beta fold family hydrolase [Caballeronia arationis]SOE58195.1 Pimeloyl-ACP methyl ester carboxylesterase [Caballeronia arationis]
MSTPTLTHADALASFPEARIDTAHRTIGYREAGAAHLRTMPVVLLHGIGSTAASWVRQMESLGATRRVLAWDAPGYGASSPVEPVSPAASDYAAALVDWLDALDLERCLIVGHSLGAIVAGAFAAEHASRVAGLMLVSPAGGYGAASIEVREEKRDARLAMLAELGPRGLADKRSANMLSAHASEDARAWVRWNMARIVPAGYAQATHLLANADLASDLARYRGRIAVAVGADDTITPPAACERIAEAARVSLRVIPHAGHAGYVESPAAYTTLIEAFCRASGAPRSI